MKIDIRNHASFLHFFASTLDVDGFYYNFYCSCAFLCFVAETRFYLILSISTAVT